MDLMSLKIFLYKHFKKGLETSQITQGVTVKIYTLFTKIILICHSFINNI